MRTWKFLSTLSLRRATTHPVTIPVRVIISIHALLAESDLIALFDFPIVPVISIHALLAESDRLGLLGWLRVLISIHALLAESDGGPLSCFGRITFLSTLSLRRATGRAFWPGLSF